jgi:uncharacterized membrane protein
MGVAVKTVGVVLTLAYPVAVFFALTHLSARTVGLLGLCVAIPFFALKYRNADREHLFAVLRVPLVVVALLLASALLDDARFVLALPVLISAALLVTFGGSLRGEMPIVERFARMKRGAQDSSTTSAAHPDGVGAGGPGGPRTTRRKDLSDAQIRHCRQATIAWCVFFAINGVVAGALAVAEMTVAWAVYTGGIAYGLMGLMFAGEYAVRVYRFGAAR